jgi:phosphate transport system permease protein
MSTIWPSGGAGPATLADLQALDPILSRRAEIQRSARERLARRKRVNTVALVLCQLGVLVAAIPLVAVLAFTVEKGVGAWSADFFTHLPTPEGVPGGGISNAIVGSLIIDAVAAAMAIPLGIGIGLFLAQATSRLAGLLRFGTDVLAGIPSIVIGVFAYSLIVVTSHHFSAFAGSFGLAVIMLPIVGRASEVALRGVPRDIVEAGQALGGRQAKITWKVVLPAALPGVITGVLLGVARAAGETAPLIFTAVGSQYYALNPWEPMSAMPLVVYIDGSQPYPDLVRDAWGVALALIVIVLLISVGSRIVAARLRRS